MRVWHGSLAEAEAAGAISLFGEKYGSVVRVVEVGDFSRELCGGTHVGHGSQVGPVHVLGEASIGANLRRIEALTGLEALHYVDRERQLLAEVAALLKTRPEDAPEQLRRRLEALATAQRELERLRVAGLERQAGELAGRVSREAGGWLVVERVPEAGADDLRRIAIAVRDRVGAGPGVVVLGSETQGKAAMVALLTTDLVWVGRRRGGRQGRARPGGQGGRRRRRRQGRPGQRRRARPEPARRGPPHRQGRRARAARRGREGLPWDDGSRPRPRRRDPAAGRRRLRPDGDGGQPARHHPAPDPGRGRGRPGRPGRRARRDHRGRRPARHPGRQRGPGRQGRPGLPGGAAPAAGRPGLRAGRRAPVHRGRRAGAGRRRGPPPGPAPGRRPGRGQRLPPDLARRPPGEPRR